MVTREIQGILLWFCSFLLFLRCGCLLIEELLHRQQFQLGLIVGTEYSPPDTLGQRNETGARQLSNGMVFQNIRIRIMFETLCHARCSVHGAGATSEYRV